MNLLNRVISYTGYNTEVTAISDKVTEWLNNTALDIRKFIPVEKLKQYEVMTEGVVTQEEVGEEVGHPPVIEIPSFTIGNSIVTGATREGHKVLFVDVGLETSLNDTNSIHKATLLSPRGVMKEGKIYIYPVVVDEGWRVYSIPAPEVQSSSISYFPFEFEDAVILKTAENVISYLISEELRLVKVPHFLVSLPDIMDFQIVDVLPDIPNPTAIDYSELTTALNNQDFELATAHIGFFNARIQEFSANLNAYNIDLDRYKTNLQTQAQQHGLNLQTFQADIQKAVQEAQGRFQADSIAFKNSYDKISVLQGLSAQLEKKYMFAISPYLQKGNNEDRKQG